jgi:hypothetical protein
MKKKLLDPLNQEDFSQDTSIVGGRVEESSNVSKNANTSNIFVGFFREKVA